MAVGVSRAPVRVWPWWNIAVTVVVTLTICCTPWLMVNITGSAPRGLWRKGTLPLTITRGMWVTLASPPSMLPWAPWWIPLLKPVAAVAGDRLCVKEETLWVMGRSYGRVYFSANGQALPRLLEGCYTVPPGQVFLASAVERSLDSRYFGPVPVTALMQEASPLWTWR